MCRKFQDQSSRAFCHFALLYQIKVLIFFTFHHVRFQWAEHDLFTGNDLPMERVGLKYQIWSESTQEGLLVFEDQLWSVQSNKWVINEQKLIRILAQIGVWLEIISKNCFDYFPPHTYLLKNQKVTISCNRDFCNFKLKFSANWHWKANHWSNINKWKALVC